MALPRDRVEEMRFRNVQSPRDEVPNYSYPAFRPINSDAAPASSFDPRTTLQRRFTTNGVATLPLSPIGVQRRQAAESADLHTATYHKVQLLEKKKREHEELRQQRQRFQSEMDLLDLQSKRGEDELQRLANELSLNGGPQSEPTTPPDYRDMGFPTTLSRPQRYSAQNIVSPNNGNIYSNRTSRSGSQSFGTSHALLQHPANSVPSTRRNSDEESSGLNSFSNIISPRNSLSIHRMSGALPLPDARPTSSDDNDNNNVSDINNIAASVLEEDSTLTMNYTKDQFPTLVRRPTGTQQPETGGFTGAAPTKVSDNDQVSNGWPAFPRHRQGQQSMPANVLRSNVLGEDLDGLNLDTMLDTPTKASLKGQRYSMELQSKPMGFMTSPPGLVSAKPNLQSSYSTSDIPTMKGNHASISSNHQIASPQTHAEQHYHKHNASIGRIPPGAAGHSRETSVDVRGEDPKALRPNRSALQANAAPFGPAGNVASPISTSNAVLPGVPPATANSYYGGYVMPVASSAYTNGQYYNGVGQFAPEAVQTTTTLPVQNRQIQLYQPLAQPQNNQSVMPYPMNASHATAVRSPDNQHRVIAERRQLQASENNARSANLDLNKMRGEIYSYCKDQHGCRFLQKKLEEKDPINVQLIFAEVKEHVVELMQDPFGNYLCQKLFELANDEQRTELIHNAMAHMVQIALNQHGTRALQKMIEHISTDEQVQMLIVALKDQVVELIQDLNGNHVIQKCLNHLSHDHCQFIFDAVGHHAMDVGTHRHGCCVLQRCIDHASGTQRAELVAAITDHAYALVQDPFGNYVVQYILDIGNNSFTQPLCATFLTNLVVLSKQKFSSNVIEKCIRVSDKDTRVLIINAIMAPNTLQRMAADSFANYVVQTAIEYADEESKALLMDQIRTILPQIRNTPHGRRFMQKIQEYDNRRTTTATQQMSVLAQNAGSRQAGHGLSMQHRTSHSQSSVRTTSSNGFGSHHGQDYINGAISGHTQPQRMTNTSTMAQYPAGLNGQQQFGPFQHVGQAYPPTTGYVNNYPPNMYNTNYAHGAYAQGFTQNGQAHANRNGPYSFF